MVNPLLGGLDDKQRLAVVQRLHRRRYRKGENIFHAGDLGDTIHFLTKGRAAVRVSTPMGEIATLTVLGPDDFFGEQALLAPDSLRTASVVALEPVETMALHYRDFNELRENDPRVDRLLIAVLAAQVRRLTVQVVEALYLPADVRVVRRLHDLTGLYGSATASSTIEILITQEDLATMAGTTRPTANRVLQDLAAAGVIELHRSRIAVIDRTLLARRAR